MIPEQLAAGDCTDTPGAGQHHQWSVHSSRTQDAVKLAWLLRA